MTNRAPHFTRFGPRERNAELLTWTHGVQQGLIPTPYPKRQGDWPNPVLRKPNLDLRFWSDALPPGVIALTIPGGQRQRDWQNPVLRTPNLETRTWLHSQQIPQSAVVQSPFNQFDWPNPTLRQPASAELRTWIEQPQSPDQAFSFFVTEQGLLPAPRPKTELLTWLSQSIRSVTAPNPFAQSDWPNPKQRAPNLDLRTWVDGIPQTALSLTLPQRQTEWPLAAGKPRTDQLGWINGLAPQTGIFAGPFPQLDWPNPGTPKRSFDLLTWVEGLPQTALSLTVPPVQKDWPNPVIARPNFELRTWSFWLQLQPTQPQPFAQYDWPNPVIAKPKLDLRTWVDGLPQSALSLTVPPVQLDWPNPVLRRPNYEFRTWIAWTQIQPEPPKPFLQTEWPNPVLRKANLELRDWKQALPPGQISKTVPPVQLDWPNPLIAKRLRIDWGNPSPIVLGIPTFDPGIPHPDIHTGRDHRTLRERRQERILRARRPKRTEH